MSAIPQAPLPPAAAGTERKPGGGASSAALGRVLQALQARAARLGGGRLAPRVMALSLLLVLTLQAAGFLVVRAGLERQARVQVGAELAAGERVWQRLLEQEAQRLRQAGQLLAADAGLRAAIGSNDREAIVAALDGHGARTGASVAALFDPALQWRAVQAGGADSAATAERVRELATPLARAAGGSRIALVNGRPHLLAVTPARGALTHWVVLALPLGQPLLDDMRSLSGLEVALVAEPGGAATQIVASTLGDGARAALLEQLSPAAPALVIDGGELLSRTLIQEAGPGVMRTLLMRPLKDARTSTRNLLLVLAALSLLGGGLVAFLSWRAGSAFAAALRALQRASERLGRGEYAVPTRHTDRHDEIGDLARAFDQMRLAIAESQAEVRRLAYIDRLTGLPNRARMRDALLGAIGRDDKPGRSAAVLMLGLDRFKHVNEVLGYAGGDRLLGTVARRLAADFGRDGAVVARFGADTFALLLPGAGAEAALGVARRVQESLALPLMLDDQAVDVAACIGIACWPAHAGDADTLLARAEVALHAAKRARDSDRDDAQALAPGLVYDPALDAASVQTLSLMSALRRAVDVGELRLALQPRVDLATGAVPGAEALLRWQHPTRGLLPAAEFTPFAEQNGFARRLTLWLFEQACRDWAALQQGGALCLSVPLFTRDLLDPGLPPALSALAQQHAVPAGGLCIEVTESAIAHEPARAEAALKALNEAGFKLSIGDFGAGYSSLAQLRRLPVDAVKIGRGFVAAMERSADDAEIVRSTIELAHSLGLSVVASGVERESHARRLVELDCDEGQGMHFSEALEAADLAAWRVRWGEQRAFTRP